MREVLGLNPLGTCDTLGLGLKMFYWALGILKVAYRLSIPLKDHTVPKAIKCHVKVLLCSFFKFMNLQTLVQCVQNVPGDSFT